MFAGQRARHCREHICGILQEAIIVIWVIAITSAIAYAFIDNKWYVAAIALGEACVCSIALAYRAWQTMPDATIVVHRVNTELTFLFPPPTKTKP